MAASGAHGEEALKAKAREIDQHLRDHLGTSLVEVYHGPGAERRLASLERRIDTLAEEFRTRFPAGKASPEPDVAAIVEFHGRLDELQCVVAMLKHDP